jgi:membrane protein
MRYLHHLWKALLKAGVVWANGRCVSMAAAVAFFSAFSLAPTLVIFVAIGGAFFGPEAVRGQVVDELRGLLGEDGALALQGMIESAWMAEATGLKTLLSVLTLLVGASATFAELNGDVNQLWRAPPRPGATAFGAFLRVRLLSIGLVVGVGFLLVVSLVLDAGIRALRDVMWPPQEAVRVLMSVVNQPVALALPAVTFGLLMKAMITVGVRLRQLALGGLVASVLFNLGKSVFGLYRARAGTADAFGAAGSLAVILMWLFYSAAVFLYDVTFAKVLQE